MSDIHRFSNWISDAQREWQPACVDLAVTAFIDTIACMIAGSRDAGTLAAMRAVADIGGAGPDRLCTGRAGFAIRRAH